ncbi:MAG: DUF6542 domain-containing protein [Gemmatimonadota bacterium]
MVHPIRQDTAWPGGPQAGAASGRPGPGPSGDCGQGRPGSRQASGAGGLAAAPAGRPGIRLTCRGALLAMAVLFFLGALAAAGLGWAWLAGLTFVAGSAVAARYASRRDLLAVTVSPPLLFLCTLVLARVLTASGPLAVSVAGGTLLTLAAVAPWLFAGVAVNLVIALLRGLPACVRDLRRGLRGIPAGYPEGRQSRRATPQ